MPGDETNAYRCLFKSAAYEDDAAGFLDRAVFLARASELAYRDEAELIAERLGLRELSVFPAPGL